jgi:integrase
MAVYDRWHRDPRPGEKPCKCGTRRTPLYPAAGHLQGDRWQVRWRDLSERQRKRNFALKIGSNPDLHADAFDSKTQGELDAGTYIDPRAGEVTLQKHAEEWRKARTHGESAATGLESRLRNHVYEGEPGSGRTPKGGASIGQHAMGKLARRPSLIAAWAAAIPLADGSRRMVIADVSAVFDAAAEDGVVIRNPVKSKSVGKPGRTPSTARPYTAAEAAGIAAGLPERLRIAVDLGVGAGLREMEMAGLGADDVMRGERPKIRVTRQLKIIGKRPCLGPVKNRKPHDVPVPPELVELLDGHVRRFPPLELTLPWHEPGSKLHGTMVPVRLMLSKDGAPATKNVMRAAWRTAVGRFAAAGAAGRRERLALSRGHGIHRTRHTAASQWLREGIDVVRVAAWLGDTVEVVMTTYAHLLPDDHAGDDAGRSATAAFLAACARSVPPEGSPATSGLLRVV